MTIHGCKDVSGLQEVNRGLVDSWLGSAAQEERQKMLKRMVRTATISMTTRERRIVNFRFGVLGKELSFEEIGQKMGLSAQDVEITFVAAMSKARRFVDETASWLKAELKRPASTTHTSGLAH